MDITKSKTARRNQRPATLAEDLMASNEIEDDLTTSKDIAEDLIASDETCALVATEFDAPYYAAQISEPNATAAQLVVDYVTSGWISGLNPSPLFCVTTYLSEYPDVAASDNEPFFHYLKYGRNEGRNAFPVEAAALHPTVASSEDAANDPFAYERRATSAYFDQAFYLKTYPDVAKERRDAFAHYFELGWKEGRDPSPEFSTAYYLASNPDVKAAGMVPLLHYALAGHAEGRQARHLGGWQADLLARTSSLQERAVAWHRRPPSRTLGVATLDALLGKRLTSPSSAGAVVALGHDRYYDHTGGIQACVQEEQLLLNQAGYSYIFINPYQPLPTLSKEDSSCWLCDVSIDGKFVGTLSGEEALSALGQHLAGANNHLLIHSLLGHNPVWPEKLAALISFTTHHFWIHDFFSLCPGFNLLRNDVSFCSVPDIDSNSCQLCIYGDERQRHLARIGALFRAVPFTLLAPSESALTLWRTKTQLPHKDARVLEHRTFAPRATERTPKNRPSRIRVAFLGHAAAHKGWFMFKDLVSALRHDDRYEFLHLSVSPDAALAITHVPVRFTRESPDAMQSAIETLGIDIALVLSSWPETFCLTAYEASAGGASVFALKQSGNVAAMINKPDIGQVFENYADLLEAFQTGASARHVADRRKQGFKLSKLISSGVTAGVIAPLGRTRIVKRETHGK